MRYVLSVLFFSFMNLCSLYLPVSSANGLGVGGSLCGRAWCGKMYTGNVGAGQDKEEMRIWCCRSVRDWLDRGLGQDR